VLASFRRFAVPALVLAAFCASASVAWAHAIGFSCKLLGDLVRVEAYFSDDTPAIAAHVVVRDEQNAIVAEGRTDDRGIWTFARPVAARYEVTVDGGAGHRLTQKLTIPELAPLPESQEKAVGDGPLRSEFTRIPWLRLAIGLGIIFLLAAGWLARAKIGRYKASPS
jgi:hypothetical protein